jgi:hypothetical protein
VANSFGRKRLLGTDAVEKVEGLFLDGRRTRGDGEGDARRGGDSAAAKGYDVRIYGRFVSRLPLARLSRRFAG